VWTVSGDSGVVEPEGVATAIRKEGSWTYIEPDTDYELPDDWDATGESVIGG